MRHMHKAAAHRLLGLLVGGCGFGSVTAQAAPFELLYTGTFNTQEALTVASASTPAYFTALTSFTIHALFDDSSSNFAPNLGGPFSSFRAYPPSSAMIDIAGAS
jgi:hypothetical protein